MKRDRSNDRTKSAAELMAELEMDPDHLEQRRRREEERQKTVGAHAKAIEPIVQDLLANGLVTRTIGDLRERDSMEYGIAVPILLRWLPRTDNATVKEEIVRTLSMPWAKPLAAAPLLDEFSRTDSDAVRWAIANALAVVADATVLDRIVGLASDRRSGKAREMLTVALGNLAHPAAEAALLDLVDDQAVVGHAIIALGALRSAKAETKIAALVGHPRKWVREEARKALAAIRGTPAF